MNYMIYPSLALFLGTGNATPDLPTIMMERLYTSPTYGMWYPADPIGLSTNLPPMVVFPEETAFYTKWKEDLERKGVHVRLNTEVNAIVERFKSKGVVVQLRGRRETEDKHNPNGADQDMPIETEHYDEIILCVLADTAKRLLGKTATTIESKVLGVPTWSDDITVTHTVSSRLSLVFWSCWDANVSCVGRTWNTWKNTFNSTCQIRFRRHLTVKTKRSESKMAKRTFHRCT